MKALVKYEAGPGNMEVREVEEPQVGPGEIKIEVKMAGICGSDLHIYHSDIQVPVRPPVTTGHEFSGVISAIGPGVTGFAVGDRVVSETAYSYCGVCEYCREGYYNLCVVRKTLGYWFNGIFTKYTVVPAGRVHHIPENVSDTAAAMTEPLACVVHAIYDLCQIRGGETVLVSGPGAIGLMAMMVARAQGAKVIVSGTSMDTERLKIATELGADRIINVQEEDLVDEIMKMTNGYGVDVVLECSGSQIAVRSALQAIKKLGHYCQIGLSGKSIDFDIETINYKELHFRGSMGSRKHSWEMALRLQAEGKVNLEPLATTKLPITEWEEAFRRFESKEGLKIMLTPVD